MLVATATAEAVQHGLQFDPAQWTLPVWILTGIGLAVLVLLWFFVDDKREESRRRAIRGSVELRGIGLPIAAEILESYAVADTTGVLKAARKLAAAARALGGADRIAARVVIKALPGLLRHPVHGPAVRDAIASAAAPPAAPPPSAPQQQPSPSPNPKPPTFP